MKFDELFIKALGALLDYNSGSLEQSLDDMHIEDPELRKQIKEFIGWDDEEYAELIDAHKLSDYIKSRLVDSNQNYYVLVNCLLKDFFTTRDDRNEKIKKTIMCFDCAFDNDAVSGLRQKYGSCSHNIRLESAKD